MDERTLRALIEAGAIKKVRIIANGSVFYVEAEHGTAPSQPTPPQVN